MRPRFQVELKMSADEALERVTRALGDPGCPVEALRAGQHVDLMIPRADRRYWSPRLGVEFEASEPASRVHGLFGPRPSVWTLFATFYALMGFMAVIGGMLGWSQWIIDQTAWGFWFLPAAVLGALGAYGLSLVGQRLSSDQMDLLYAYLAERLGLPAATHRRDEPEMD
jgi:hypothetical protein